MMATELKQETLAEFVARTHITMKVYRIEIRPDADELDWRGDARHWYVELRALVGVVRTMGLFFTQGSAHTKAPTVEDILDCLKSDASFGPSFKEFCDEFGAEDAHKARKTWKACRKSTRRLRALVGDQFDSLMNAESL